MICCGATKDRRKMKVYCCQTDIAWENKTANFQKVQELLAEAKPEPGSLCVLPEMFATGFSMNSAAIAESPGGPTDQFLKETAAQLDVSLLAGTVAPGPNGLGLNQAAAFSPKGKELVRYSKIHPFTLGGELAHYARGRAIQYFDWHGLRTVPFICYDLRFPELFRAAAARGAELFVVIANWPNRREQHWMTLLQARAIENLAYVVGVNRSGKDPGHVYPGRSLVVDPHGTIIADAGSTENVVSAEIIPEVVRDWRRDFPALKDMHWRDEEI
jgi:predicted amidohydrolase